METIELTISNDQVEPLINELLRIGFIPVADNLIQPVKISEDSQKRT